MILDRRKPKKCRKCGKVKQPDEYYKTKTITKFGDTVYYCTTKCIECNNKPRPKPMHKPTFKRCHMCCKYQPATDFREFKQGRLVIESNWCRSCEAVAGEYKPPKDEKVRPTVNDSDKIDYYCGFIGKHSYRHICKVYGIRYSTENLLNEQTYEQMN